MDLGLGLWRPPIDRKPPLFLVGKARDGYCPAPETMTHPVYKILTEAAFRDAERSGHFAGSADDVRDGFIHLSAAHQIEGTLAKHFAREEELVLLALDAVRLGPQLKWETSRGGDLFPHLYAPLDLSAVLWCERIGLGEDGVHRLPKGIAA